MQIVKKLKEAGQDFEWYPTTDQIVNVIKNKISDNDPSVLDCGAGDGRVLEALTDGKRFAIEKAIPLIQAMKDNIFIVGTEFFQSTLIDKKVDIVFSNPPYSEYEEWATKIITESHAKKIFLVIPTRWKKSNRIKSAIEKREAKVYEIGTFDFLEAERKARAEVNILEIILEDSSYYQRMKVDPFGLWFDNEFDYDEVEEDEDEDEDEDNDKSTLKNKLNKAVVEGRGMVPMLVQLYNNELSHLHGNYKKLSQIDTDLLSEVGVYKESIKKAIKLRITGLKDKYWKELFDNLKDITSRLTVRSRDEMYNHLTAQTNVDFTESNIYAVLIWVIKNANKYYDQQLITTVEKMVNKANVFKYKSNHKVWVEDRWRYRDIDPENSHYGLELRIIIGFYDAILDSTYSEYNFPNNLYQDAHDFINDLITIGDNLNFITPHIETTYNREWESNKKQDFCFQTTDKDLFVKTKYAVLFSVKAFKNGNLHIKFNQKFIRKLNVEFGRLKGWLKDKHGAAEELNIPIEEAQACFGSNKQLVMNNIKLLK